MGETDEKLLGTVRRLLRPLIRLLVEKNVTLQVLTDEIKALYVHEAEHALLREFEKATDSHISLMTGVHRKDVKVYRARNVGDIPAEKPLSIGAELLARWAAEYTSADGKPKALTYKSKEPPSFITLAENVSTGIPPRALLDELVRQNFIEYDELNDKVILRSEAFLPQKDFEDKLHYVGLNSGDHLDAAITNLLSDKPPFLDRSVYHDGLTQESVSALRKIAVEGAMKLLRQINREAFKRSEKDKKNAKATLRINLGTYLFAADTTKEKP